MASNSGRRYGSSGHSPKRKRVVIGAKETVRVRYDKDKPTVESESRKKATRDTRGNGARPKSKPSAAGRRHSAAKREERERRQQTLLLKRSAVFAALAVAFVLVIWGIVALYRSPLFLVEEVVVNGEDHLAAESVVASAAIPAETSLHRLPASEIEARLARDPWIRSVKVSRDYPHTVVIDIVERKPSVVVDAGGKELWVVSTDGYWLGIRSTEETGLLTVLDLASVEASIGAKTKSEELTNAIKVINGISPELRARVRSISAPSVEKTALTTVDDIEIFIGEATDLKAKDRVIQEILAQEAGSVVYINVRVVDSPTWRGIETSP